MWSYMCGAVVLWLPVELAYYLLNRSRYGTVNCQVEVPIVVEELRKVKDRFLTLSAFMSLEDFASGWFLGATLDEVKRGNAEAFVAYSMYCRRKEDLSEEMQREVEDFVRQVESRWHHSLEDGTNPDIQFMAHLWEPLRTLHTPLFIHLVSECMSVLSMLALALLGFQRHRCQGVVYWLKPQGGSLRGWRKLGPALAQRWRQFRSRHDIEPDAATLQKASIPCLFAHGVGFGLLPYLGFLWQLVGTCPGSAMMVLDIPHVSMRMGHRAVAFEKIAGTVPILLHRHGFESACLVGHSFGSFVISKVCQLYSETVDSVVLLDPVCCMTCFPKLLHNFVYHRYPSFWEVVCGGAGVKHGLRFLFSRDLIISEANMVDICRHFAAYFCGIA